MQRLKGYDNNSQQQQDAERDQFLFSRQVTAITFDRRNEYRFKKLNNDLK